MQTITNKAITSIGNEIFINIQGHQHLLVLDYCAKGY